MNKVYIVKSTSLDNPTRVEYWDVTEDEISVVETLRAANKGLWKYHVSKKAPAWYWTRKAALLMGDTTCGEWDNKDESLVKCHVSVFPPKKGVK